ncbi:MAG: amidohydrolase family protein, partial [Candidatus Hinthialibacter sp.]
AEVIDAHVHVALPHLSAYPPEPPTPSGHSLDESSLETIAADFYDEMQSAGVTHALCMPQYNAPANDPLGIVRTVQLASLVPGLHPIGLADPTRTNKRHLDLVEEELKQKKIVAFKAYLGYLYYGPSSPEYEPYYDLAARYNLPFIFHTGDTYSDRGKLKYSHPLLVDETAVDHPNVRFVFAHLGCPWFRDGGELIFKNNLMGGRENLWCDVSGILCGLENDFEEYWKTGYLKQEADKIREAFFYSERPDRFLYGSDWPLAPLPVYRDFIREAIPEEYHQAVFHNNAKDLFGL